MDIKKISKWLLDNCNALFVTALFVFIVAIAGFHKFTFVTNLHHFFADDEAYKVQHDMLVEDYGLDSTIIIGVTQKANDKNFSILTRENLQASVDILEMANDIPYASGVDGIAYSRYSYNQDGYLATDNLFADMASFDDAELTKRIAYAKNEELLIGRLLSADEKMLAAYVNVEWDAENRTALLQEISAYLATMDEAIAKSHPHLKLIFSGNVLLENSMLSLAKKDMTTLIPIILFINFLTLFLVMRSLSLVAVSSIIVFSSVLMTFGLTSWLGTEFNQISLMASTLIIVLALASTVHFLMNFIQFYGESKDKYQALLKSYEINLRPVFFTVVTTALGFLMLNLADSPSFKLLGNIALVGVFCGLFLLAFVFPFLILRLPVNVPENYFNMRSFMESVGRFAIKYKNILFVAFTTLIVFSACFIMDNKLNDDAFTYFDESLRFRQDTDLFTASMAGRRQLEISLMAREEGAINEPAFLNTLEQFSDWARQHPNVNKVYSYEAIIKSLNKTMNEQAQATLPATREGAAELLLTYEFDMPEGQSLDSFVKYDKSAVKITVILGLLSNDQILELEREFRTWLDTNASDYKYIISSNDLMFAALGKDVLSSMTLGSILAVFLICFMLIWGLRSFKYGLLSFIPNALPAVIVYGLWGLLVVEVNMSIAVTFSIALGLVVDDTVHIFSKYLDGRRAGIAPEEALIQAYKVTGPALVLTTFIIVSGCMVQSFSMFGVNAIVGLLTALMVGVALVFDLLFLPSVLLFLDKKAK